MKKQIKSWLEFAEKDLKTAKVLLEKEELRNITSFHCQQCVEKSLKAIILQFKNNIPRVHDLLRLYSLIKDEIGFDLNEENLKTLNEIYVDSRYPGDMGLLPDGTPSKKRVKQFYDFANLVLKKVKKYLNEYL